VTTPRACSPESPRTDDFRVAIATITRPTGTTGVQTHVNEAFRFLAERGRRPRIITPYSWGGLLSIPVFGARRVIHPLSGSVSIAWYRYWHYVFLRRALERELALPGSVVVYAQCALSARAAIEARRDPSQRVVVAIHSDGSQADEWVDKTLLKVGSRYYRAIAEMEKRDLPKVDGIVYVSEAARKGMTEHVEGLDRIPSAVIRNFVGTASVPPSSGRSADLVTVGGLELAKNHEYLLRILDVANRSGHRYTLDLIGDGPCRRPLERLSKSLGLEGQVTFLGARSDVRSLLPNYRAYVHTSLRESLCMAIIEAMAAELAVVAGAVGGIPELFEPGREGLFWPLDDPDGAAKILIDLLEDERTLESLGAGARKRYESCFDAAVVGPALEQLLFGNKTGPAPSDPAPSDLAPSDPVTQSSVGLP
jgi:glycosyltransferase involved in cell wall biosynthesis